MNGMILEYLHSWLSYGKSFRSDRDVKYFKIPSLKDFVIHRKSVAHEVGKYKNTNSSLLYLSRIFRYLYLSSRDTCT